MRSLQTIRSLQLSLEEAFQALPPLGSKEYIEYVEAAAWRSIPPETLVRAYYELRKLPMPKNKAARVTLERLFHKHKNIWEYLIVPRTLAEKFSRHGWETSEDLVQDFVERILKVLATEERTYATQRWAVFCNAIFTDAWREGHGRKGGKIVNAIQDVDQEGDTTNNAEYSEEIIAEIVHWHNVLSDFDQTEQIERIIDRVLDEITDPFVRKVAEIIWTNPEMPEVSRKRDGLPPLTDQLNVDRFKIHRAKRQANAHLATALLNDPYIVWSKEWGQLLDELRSTVQHKVKLEKHHE